VRKVLNILQVVPVEYYQKARELKEKKETKETKAPIKTRKSRSPTIILQVDNDPIIEKRSISVTEKNASAISNSPHLPRIKNLVRGYSQEAETSAQRSRRLRGFEVAKREEKLFFSPLNRYINSLSSRKRLNKGEKSFSMHVDRLNKTLDDASPQKADTSVWIQKISEIKDNIESCLTKIPTQIK